MTQAVVDELLVNLVPDEEKVVLFGQPHRPLQLLGRVDGPGGIVGRTEEDGLRPRRDPGLDVLFGRQPEAVLDLERQGDDPDGSERRVTVVVRIVGLGDKDLLAGVGHDGKSEVDGLRAARRHHDIVGFDRDAVAVEVAGDGLPQLLESPGTGHNRGHFHRRRGRRPERAEGSGCRGPRYSDERRGFPWPWPASA